MPGQPYPPPDGSEPQPQAGESMSDYVQRLEDNEVEKLEEQLKKDD